MKSTSLRRLGQTMCCVAAWSAGPVLAQGAHLGGGTAPDIPVARILAALLVCLIVAALAIFMIRQRGGRPISIPTLGRIRLAERSIEVVETRRLGVHGDVCLIRHARTEYLVILMAGHVHVLAQQPHLSDDGATSCD